MGQSPAGTGMGTDGMGAREVYREIVLDNIEYEYLVQDDHIEDVYKRQGLLSVHIKLPHSMAD